MDYTITFNDSSSPENRGWTSFWDFNPEGMLRMNNRFFTFKNGNLYEHHNETVPRCNFYGVQYTAKISPVINKAPSEVKVLKAISQEGTEAWDVTVKAFESDSVEYQQSDLPGSLFSEKEGLWYAHTRRAEATSTDEGDRPVYGIGVSTAVSDPTITIGGVTKIPSSIMVGDEIYKEGDVLLGLVSGKSLVGGVLTLTVDDSVVGDFTQLVNGDFVYGKKNVRIDGSPLRGYVFRLDMESDATTRVELYGVNAEVIKSYR